MAAGQASECLYTMTILQAYQADLLKDLDEGEGVGYDTIKGATKGMAHIIGCSMSALVAMEGGVRGGTPLQSAWMKLWLLSDSRASVCSITSTTG